MGNFEFDEKQKKAIELCCDKDRRIVAITGEAGTGKTTIIKEVYKRLYSEHNVYDRNKNLVKIVPDIVVAAPTGKAAKRIYELTGIPAITLHRLLEYPMPGEIDETTGKPKTHFGPKRDHDNPLDQKIVICDEYAMVNVELHRNLINALPRGGMVRMFGDCNQLEPIEEISIKGDVSPFNEALKKFPSVVLSQIHRQSDDSSIIKCAHQINLGMIPQKSDDFRLLITGQDKQPTDLLVDIVTKDPDFFTQKKQILSPTKVRWVGTEKLNPLIQACRFFGKDEEGVPIERHPWCKVPLSLYVGDKVIITKNNYDLGVFNGETGIVKEVYLYGDVVVDLGDRDVKIPCQMMVQSRKGYYVINPQRDLDLAYVITTHKAQGSEYEEVVYVMDKAVIFNQSRKNLYTAVTRAKKKVTIITDQRSLMYSLTATKSMYNR